jgi:putative addiction module CopG family antidote
MDISLTPELEQFVFHKVESGKYPSASDVIRDALQLLEKLESNNDEFSDRVKNKVTIHQRVNMALDILSPEEKRSVYRAIDYLEFFGIDPSEGANVKRIKTDEPIYLLKVDRSIRLILQRLEQDKIEVLDLVRSETLKLFAERNSESIYIK